MSKYFIEIFENNRPEPTKRFAFNHTTDDILTVLKAIALQTAHEISDGNTYDISVVSNDTVSIDFQNRPSCVIKCMTEKETYPEFPLENKFVSAANKFINNNFIEYADARTL